MDDDPRLQQLEQWIDCFFPPQLRQALTLLVRYRIVEPERRMGPFLRDAMVKAKGDGMDFQTWFSIQVPLSEAAGLLQGFEALAARLRLSAAGSHPQIDPVIGGRDAFAIVRVAFEILAECE